MPYISLICRRFLKSALRHRVSPSPWQILTLKTTLWRSSMPQKQAELAQWHHLTYECCSRSPGLFFRSLPSPLRAGTHLLTSICILVRLSVTLTPFLSVRPFETGNTSTHFKSQHESQVTHRETRLHHQCWRPFGSIPSLSFQGLFTQMQE